MIDLSKCNSIEVDGVDFNDYPDFCDAYASYGKYEGREMTSEELEIFTNQCPERMSKIIIEKCQNIAEYRYERINGGESTPFKSLDEYPETLEK